MQLTKKFLKLYLTLCPYVLQLHLQAQGAPEERESTVKIATKAKCGECSRVFDLMDEEQAEEFYYGHDCEAE
jgi:hypothetical protein